MVIVKEKSSHEEHSFQPLQANIKQFKLALTFSTGYNGTFNIIDKNINLFFTTSISDEDFSVFKILVEAYKGKILKEGYFTAGKDPFLFKPNFSTLGSIIEIEPNFMGTQISFIHDNRVGDIIGLDSVVNFYKPILSHKPVDILSFDNTFLETDIAQGIISKGERSEINPNFTMDLDLWYKFIETFWGGMQWCVMDSKDFISK